MGVTTERYIRKPLYVDAVRVSAQNFEAVAAWCSGEIQKETEGPRAGTSYIRVRVQYPKSPRQSKAFIGDWVLYTETGYKVYTNPAFRRSFDPVEQDGAHKVQELPAAPAVVEEATAAEAEHGAVTGADPEFEGVTPSRTIDDAELKSFGPVAEEPDPTGTGVQPIESVEPRIDESSAGIEEVVDRERPDGLPTHTPQGEEIEYVEATPEAIADVVNEQQPVTPEPQAESVAEQAPEDAAAGKRVLSVEEQEQMGPDQVRELLGTGEVVLAQDLAA
jgi:hypothetical protein